MQCSGEVVIIQISLKFRNKPRNYNSISAPVDCTMDPRTDYIAAKYAGLRGFGPLACPRDKFLDLAPYGPSLGSSTCSRIVLNNNCDIDLIIHTTVHINVRPCVSFNRGYQLRLGHFSTKTFIDLRKNCFLIKPSAYEGQNWSTLL